MKQLLAILLTALLMTQLVLAIGVSPARFNFEVEKNSTQEFSIRVMNNDNMNVEIELMARGNLAEFVEFERNNFQMNADESMTSVKAEVNVPEDFNKTERQSTDIIVMATPADQGALINVVGAVIAKLYVTVPETPEFNTSHSTKEVPTPKGGEELSNESSSQVEKSYLSGSSPFVFLLWAILALFTIFIIRKNKNENK